jgi:hypothetical protein
LGKSVREVEQFGAAELNEWEAYWRQEPWGAYRDNIHTGLICSILSNIHRRKGAPEVSYDAFILRDKIEQQEMETRKTLSWFRGVARRK